MLSGKNQRAIGENCTFIGQRELVPAGSDMSDFWHKKIGFRSDDGVIWNKRRVYRSDEMLEKHDFP